MAKGKAVFKYNNGLGALLCTRCRTIIKEAQFFTEEELKASKGEIKLKPQYCDRCEEKMIYGEV